ncbi:MULTISPECIES: chemotaxis protein CheB [Chitinophaga]|uniref:chemotaxis protein CheB n=1 Tax=Chitinophaga TaxID=79328 RepID=UPI001CEDEF30|nr:MULTISPECIES: chemotaxis protein CheB [Chitinophaga]
MILIGGSAGSMPVLEEILKQWPAHFPIPLVIVLHRLKNVPSELVAILSSYRKLLEPEDKEALLPGHIYLAPQNYHLLIESDVTFSLDYSEPVNFSRPSIDQTFSSAAAVFGEGALGILLSGASKDGTEGLCDIVAAGGTGIVQEPDSALFRFMPASALDSCNGILSMSVTSIIDLIKKISVAYKS